MAQLFHASRLDLARFSLICDSVRDTILNDGQFDSKLWPQLNLDDEKFDIDDARACFGAMHFIITNSCLYGVEGELLRLELEQSGLPSGHSQYLCKSFESVKEFGRQAVDD